MNPRRVLLFSAVPRAAFLVAAVLACAMMVMGTGCSRRITPVRQAPMPFESPLPPVALASYDMATVRGILEQRAGRLRTLRANLDITVGTPAGNQIFQTMLFLQRPDSLRVRGSQNVGTIFDILVRRGQVQALIMPESRHYSGTLAAAAANPELLAGVSPLDLMGLFTADRTFLQRLDENPRPTTQQTVDKVLVRFDFFGGTSEVYSLRKQDLLIDAVQRLNNGQPNTTIRYSAYTVAQERPIPTRFLIDLPGGGQVAGLAKDLRLDEPAPPAVFQMEVPPGFQTVPLGQ